MSRRLSISVVEETGVDIASRALSFLLLSGLVYLITLVMPTNVRPMILGMAAGLFMMATAVAGRSIYRSTTLKRDMRRGGQLVADLSEPAFATDRDARILGRNALTDDFPETTVCAGLSKVFQGELADPSVVLDQMMRLAIQSGGARQEMASGRVLHLAAQPDGFLIWTVSEAETDEDETSLPVLKLSEDNQILWLNACAKRVFGAVTEELTTQFSSSKIRNGASLPLKTKDGECRMTFVVSNEDEGARTITVVPQINTETAPIGDTVLAHPGLLDALPVPMLKIASDGTLIEANTEARAIFGLKGGPLPPLFELVEGMGRPISDWLTDAAEGRGLLQPEIVRAVVPGQELFLQIALGRMLENNEVVLVGILNDATELKTLEAQFVQSQKMQAIGQLAGGVAHDFNNLLTAISGHCDLLLLRHDAGDPEYSDLIQISQNSNRAASLVGQLLAFSRKQNLKPQSLDIRDTMSDLAHLLNRLIGERIQLDVTHEFGPQTIRADRRQLEQVIVNLVVNARDAMPDGGTIFVRTRPEFLETEETRDRARLTPGSYVVIEVEDTGVGIGSEGLTKIFEPFYTTKKTGEGTGLGLSTAYGIVKQTGGYIFVESEVGQGTKFSLYFRATQKKKPETIEAAPAEERTEPGDGVVLLVEDEAPVRAFAARALRLRGYTVVEAECAEDALEILEDDALTFDIFVTDVIMPGLDGPTWVRQALKKRPDTRVVFMSGYAEEGRAEKQARIPNSVFLPKPFSLQKLTSVVQDQLR